MRKEQLLYKIAEPETKTFSYKDFIIAKIAEHAANSIYTIHNAKTNHLICKNAKFANDEAVTAYLDRICSL